MEHREDVPGKESGARRILRKRGNQMNDRYLFKAKRTDNGEWVEGNCINDGVTGQVFIHASGNSVNESDKVGEDGCLRFVAFEVDSSTICQCTGLKDKDGKLIWENDVVEAWSQGTCARGKIYHRIDGTWIMYPAWQKGEMWYLLTNENGETTVEIVGNIFDNPELLEVQS